MAKILVFSDLHFFRGRLDYLLQTCNWVAEQIQSLRPNMVVFCGDLNHSHNSVETDTLHAMTEAISVVAAAAKRVTGDPLIALSGNHDTALKSTERNVVEALGFLSGNIHPVTTPQSFRGFCFAPYPPAGDKFDSYLADLHKIAAPVVFAHWELSDIAYSPASPQESDHPFPIPVGTKVVVNGHYHHPMAKNIGAGVTALIVGSPCYHSYSDCMVETPRGLMLLDVEVDGRINSVTRVENPHGPIYHTIESQQIPAVLQHANLPRMRLRVKVKDKEDYEANKAAVLRLRETALSVRVMAASADTVAQIHQQESTTVNVADPFAMLKAYATKKNLDPKMVASGESILFSAINNR